MTRMRSCRRRKGPRFCHEDREAAPEPLLANPQAMSPPPCVTLGRCCAIMAFVSQRIAPAGSASWVMHPDTCPKAPSSVGHETPSAATGSAPPCVLTVPGRGREMHSCQAAARCPLSSVPQSALQQCTAALASQSRCVLLQSGLPNCVLMLSLLGAAAWVVP